MDADEKFSRATDGPSERVRQADERSEGTAKRREDRPNRGISQPAQTPLFQRAKLHFQTEEGKRLRLFIMVVSHS